MYCLNPEQRQDMNLLDHQGHRKYLNASEREAFKSTALRSTREVRTFCHVLLYTGCRISEALALSVDRVDFEGGVLTLESLKKRKTGIFRSVPVPPTLLDSLDMVHGLKKQKKKKKKQLIWSWSRATASRKVAEVMKEAGIEGIQASPKGLRHGFGVACVEKHIPLNMIQKWLGHADMATTAIYVDAVGEEEQSIASRLWD